MCLKVSWLPLQPSNILLNSDCLVKMADFGLARSVAQLRSEVRLVQRQARQEHPVPSYIKLIRIDARLQTAESNPILTDYVATRWYRAPEILLSSTRYTFGVDM